MASRAERHAERSEERLWDIQFTYKLDRACIARLEAEITAPTKHQAVVSAGIGSLVSRRIVAVCSLCLAILSLEEAVKDHTLVQQVCLGQTKVAGVCGCHTPQPDDNHLGTYVPADLFEQGATIVLEA